MKRKNLKVEIDDEVRIQDAAFNEVPVKIIAESEDFIPKYQSEYAGGCDLVANLPSGISLPPRGIVKIDCGIRIELPLEFVALVLPRSGTLSSKGVQIINSPGLIDSDYTGTIFVKLINNGREVVNINHKDRIAQLFISPRYVAKFIAADKLSETKRGENGDGSTGG